MNPFKAIKEKGEMSLLILGIERIFKNWITTVLGLLLGFAAVVASTYNFIPKEFMFHGMPLAATLLKVAGVALAIAGAIAKDKHIGINPPTLPPAAPLILIALALFATCAKAQNIGDLPTAIPPADGNNIYAVGANYSINAQPGIAGSLLYARQMLPDSDTWAFTNADFVPNTVKPFTVTNNVGAGIAQRVAILGNVPVYCISGAGVSWSGTNTGFEFNGGCMATIKLKNGLLLMPAGRFLKSSVSNGSGYQPIIGLYVGKRF
jgi:hypothetical protein